MTEKILIICGTIGAGKTTLINYLVASSSSPFVCGNLVTSREVESSKRNQKEMNIKHLSKEDFEQRMIRGEIVYHQKTEDGNHWDGILRSDLEKVWANKKIPIFEMGIREGLALSKRSEMVGIKTLPLLVVPPPEQSFKIRLRQVGYSDRMKDILSEAEKDSASIPFFGDRVIPNEILHYSTADIERHASKFYKTRA